MFRDTGQVPLATRVAWRPINALQFWPSLYFGHQSGKKRKMVGSEVLKWNRTTFIISNFFAFRQLSSRGILSMIKIRTSLYTLKVSGRVLHSVFVTEVFSQLNPSTHIIQGQAIVAVQLWVCDMQSLFYIIIYLLLYYLSYYNCYYFKSLLTIYFFSNDGWQFNGYFCLPLYICKKGRSRVRIIGIVPTWKLL